ncbi:hypothetical protein BJV78DRAFT_1208103 [Lactifluus subvellereus]|nr:hypothetical protein BJV78DRAFT_1208103 [Lactifluus subvellereus]
MPSYHWQGRMSKFKLTAAMLRPPRRSGEPKSLFQSNRESTCLPQPHCRAHVTCHPLDRSGNKLPELACTNL